VPANKGQDQLIPCKGKPARGWRPKPACGKIFEGKNMQADGGQTMAAANSNILYVHVFRTRLVYLTSHSRVWKGYFNFSILVYFYFYFNSNSRVWKDEDKTCVFQQQFQSIERLVQDLCISTSIPEY
jgi:hypothetical protein